MMTKYKLQCKVSEELDSKNLYCFIFLSFFKYNAKQSKDSLGIGSQSRPILIFL